MIVLIDGVRYRLATPENEAVLEQAIQRNCQDIFGPDSFYFEKKRMIKSRAGVASIPDGYVIFFGPEARWCVLEVELAAHAIYDHLIPQLTKFNRGIEEGSTRRKLVEMFYETITDDEILKARLKQKIGSGEIYKFLADLISEAPLTVVAIDERTDELEEAVRDIRGEVKVLDFKIFQRVGVSDEINTFVFEPIVKTREKRPPSGITVIEEERGTGVKRRGIMKTIYALFDEKGVENVTYKECEALARSIKPNTAFNRIHFSWYKRDYRMKSGTPRQAERIKGEEYGEELHTKGKPQKIIELFHSIDNFCFELDRKNIQKNYQKKYIKYSFGGNIFCCLHLWNTLIRVWLKLKYGDLDNPPECVRDVTGIGHWGVGDVEVAINSFGELEIAKGYIRKSFEESRSK